MLRFARTAVGDRPRVLIRARASAWFLACVLVACRAATPNAPTRVLFFSERDGNAEIYVMNVDGTEPERLTFHSASDTDPDISPDGRLIVFTSDRDGDREIYVMPITGGEPTNLTQNDSADAWARWSPDGSRIAFHSNRDGNFEIYTMAPDGSDVTRVTSHESMDVFPDWTPDGTQLLFGRDFSMWIVNADGTGARPLESGGLGYMPVESPDRSLVAAMAVRDGHMAVYVMNEDGTQQRRITPLPADTTGFGDVVSWAQGFGEGAPAWSRDGRLFLTSASPETGGDPEIFVMNADGTARTRLTNAPGMDGSPRPFR